jgi:hypothetical protein
MENLSRSRDQLQGPGGNLVGWPLVLIFATASAVIVPFFFLGIPSGHDFEFHLNSWMEVLSQWRQGIIYPRWAALAHYGYGEARYVFYPPASWCLGAALGAVLPWKIVPGAYIWLSLTLSGCSMFVFARRWLNRPDALWAALMYAANPYYIVIVYWRSAYAELLAGALLPLLLRVVMEMDESGGKAVVPLALIIAAAALTNAPASVMVNYSVALLALTLAIRRRSPRILLYAAGAALLGAALAAFYILPAFYEEKWIHLDQLLSPGVRPQDNFLFTTIADPDHNRFNRLISVVASAELAILAVGAFFSRRRRLEYRHLWTAVMTWGTACAFLMFSVSLFLWQHLPLLRFVQLPWRWLLCLNLALALLLSLASKQWLWRGLAFLLMLAAVAYAWHRVQPPWWDNARDVADMLAQQKAGAGYEGTDEYVPADAEPYDVRPDAPVVASNKGARLQVRMQRWDPDARAFTVDAAESGKLVLRLFNYPAWQVEVNGRNVKTETQYDTGQMLIPIAAGEDSVRMSFVRTWDQTAGDIVSLVTVTGLAFWRIRQRFRRT